MDFKSICKYAVIVLVILSVLFSSCRKFSENVTETSAIEDFNISQSVAAFFNIPNNSPEEIKKINESLKKENDLRPFVNNLIKELGIPI